jgi:radical SAM superfamily enzyme YgiQ (UPF0313 family)
MFEHVLCVYPYRRELNQVGFMPPLGLEFIAAVVQPHARAIDVVDLRKEAGRTGDFLRPDTDLVCFSVNWDRDAAFLLDEIRSVPEGIFTVVGGRHATEDPERWLAVTPNVNAVVRGDGEEAMAELCEGVPLERIQGLSYRSGMGIVHNPNRKTGQVRDDLFPDRRLRRYPYEVTIQGVGTGLGVDTVSASRGCPFSCRFCSFSRNPWGEKRRWSGRSPESVVEELSQITAPLVCFTDDLFTLDMNRVERLCDLILARGIRKRYIVNARLEVARRPDVLRKMERAGFSMLMLGVESAHDRILESMGKGFGTEQIRKYFKVLRRSSMLLHSYFIVGNIGESVEDILKIASFSHELGTDTIALSALRVSPHSGLEDLVAQFPDYHIARNGRIYSDHCSVQDLRRLRRRIYREFYTPRQVVHSVCKVLQNGALAYLPGLLRQSPRIAWRVVKDARRRAKRRRNRKRAVVPEIAPQPVRP